MVMLDINDFRDLCLDETMAIKQHSKKRFFERNITVDNIKNAINTGEIIERYEDDKPFPSCLISGLAELQKDSAEKNRYIHVVASIGEGYLHIITAYQPGEDRWENDFKIRKGRKL